MLKLELVLLFGLRENRWAKNNNKNLTFWIYKCILNKEHFSYFLFKLPLVTMWWHGSALPSGLWIQRLSSGFTVCRVPSDGSQTRGETEQEIQIHPPCGAECAHIQVRLMGKELSEQQSVTTTAVLPAHTGLEMCTILYVWTVFVMSNHLNVHVN